MSGTNIVGIVGRRVWDSRGRPTVEAEVVLAGGAIGRGIAPAGASRGTHEAIDLRDGGTALGGYGVARALEAVGRHIAPALAGMDASDQPAIDAALIALDGTPNKARLGGNATVAVSMAVLNAAAAAAGEPLWRHLAQGRATRLPLPQVQIFGGGAHAGRRIDIQDLMAVPLGAGSCDQAFAMIAEVYHAAGKLMAQSGRLAGVADEGGFWPDFKSNEEALETLTRAIEAAGFTPGDEVAIALDIAASEFGAGGRYRLALDRRELDRDAWIALLLDWVSRFAIISIEDPLAQDDDAGMLAFTRATSGRIQVVGDDYLVTNADRIARAARAGACNAALIKPNQAGTVSEAHAALAAARASGWRTIVSARSGETEDVTIAHLATGWDAGQLKVGAFARSERMAKWNELLRIEAQAGAAVTFAGRAALAVPARSPSIGSEKSPY